MSQRNSELASKQTVLPEGYGELLERLKAA